MKLDEFQARWAEQDRMLAESVRLNRAVLRRLTVERARRALRWRAVFLILGAAPGVAAAAWLGGFIFDHAAEPAFWLPALLLDAYSIGLLALAARQAVQAARVDYGQPLAAIQRQLESLRRWSLRTLQLVLFTAALVWPPLVIVGLKGLLGLDAYALLGVHWLGWNLLFGVALIPVLAWAARALGRRAGEPGFFRELARDAGGYHLRRAEDILDELAELDGEPRPGGRRQPN